MRETRQVRRTGLRRHSKEQGQHVQSYRGSLGAVHRGSWHTMRWGRQARWKATEQAGPWGPEDALSLGMKEE